MQLTPNPGKNLVITVERRRFERWPVKTKLITPEDKDILPVVEEFTKPHIKPGDILSISEKAVAVTQGRSYHIKDIKASWLATFLSSTMNGARGSSDFPPHVTLGVYPERSRRAITHLACLFLI